ncbi:hypothetical protein TNCT_714661 [Trichonephila clavata]|uniref:Uncharacterized protein n=1 Tax=Trichonephila clavata TaxID=2740835 RepID=A0A8X6HA31_TRICU|nr:hypothetical protein TNCT_714661 [Trichonephila clavata]
MKTYFGFLFSMARFSGLPLFHSAYLKKPTKLMCVFFWGINIIRMLSLLYSCVSMSFLLRVATLRFTYISFNICGTVVVLLTITKRHKIRKAVDTLIQLSLELNRDSFIGSRHSVVLGVFQCAFVVTIAVSQIVFYSNKKQETRFTNVTIFGRPLRNRTLRIFLDVHYFAGTFTYTNSSAVVCTASLMFFNIYTALDNITKWYHRRIQKMLNKVPINSGDIFENISFFRRIFNCIGEVEEAIALSTLFLYGASITWIFSSFNALIIHENAYKISSALLIVGITCFMALVVILMLTISASNIVLRDKALKRSLVHFAEKPFMLGVLPNHQMCNFTLMHHINLLSQLIREYKFQLTGGHMFVIQRGLIFTGLGIIFSYGMVIDQLNN